MGVAVSVAFLAVTLARVDTGMLARAWASVSYPMLVIALVVSAAEVAVRAFRWRFLLRPFVPVSFGAALGFLSIGHLANAILPARLGDLTRALLTGGRTQSSRASVLGTIAVERIADAGLLGLAATVGVIVGFGHLAPTVLTLAIAAGAAGVVGVLIAVVLGRETVQSTRIGSRLSTYGRKFIAGAAALRDWPSLVRIALLTLASFTLAVMIMFIVTNAVGLSLPVWQAALVMAAVTLSTAIPAGPASVGTYEFVGTLVLTTMGHPAEVAFLAVGLVHLVATVVPATMGAVAMWALGITPIRATAPSQPSIDRV